MINHNLNYCIIIYESQQTTKVVKIASLYSDHLNSDVLFDTGFCFVS